MLGKLFRAFDLLGVFDTECDNCGRKKSGKYWVNDNYSGKKFCIKKCLNEYIDRKEYEAVDTYDIDKPIVVEEIITKDEHIKKNMYIQVFRYGAVNSKKASWWQVSAVNLNNEDKINPGGDLFTDEEAKEKAIEYAKKLTKRYKTNVIKIIENEAK